MVYLDRNENNYGPAPACFDVLRRADLSKLSWYDRAFTLGKKSILSSRLANDFGVAEDRVILGNGAEDILKQAIQCYLGRQQKLMVPSYSWWYYKSIASEVEGVSVEYPLIVGTESFRYDLEGMQEIYNKERPRVVFISSPNNPTGNSLTLADLTRMLQVFQDSLVVLDEAYKYSGQADHIKDLIDANPNLLVVRTFSKYYALAGARIGFALRGANLTALSKFTNRYLGFHRLSEELALAALDSPDYYADIARKMSEDKRLYYEELGQLPGFTVFRSDANFILVAIPAKHKEPLQQFLKERGLILKFMNEPLLNSHIRITIGTKEENRMVIDAFKAFFR